jgi:hypothetical protein
MAMTDHRKVDTVLGYFKAGQLSGSKAGNLFDQDSKLDRTPK